MRFLFSTFIDWSIRGAQTVRMALFPPKDWSRRSYCRLVACVYHWRKCCERKAPAASVTANKPIWGSGEGREGGGSPVRGWDPMMASTTRSYPKRSSGQPNTGLLGKISGSELRSPTTGGGAFQGKCPLLLRSYQWLPGSCRIQGQAGRQALLLNHYLPPQWASWTDQPCGS